MMTQNTLWSDALSLLEQNGWIKDRSEDGIGRICLGQAIHRAFDARGGGVVDEIHLPPAINKIFQCVESRLGGDSVTQWNDSPERTWSDVETLLWDLHLECKEGQE